MKLTPRERVLLLALPVAVVLGGYAAWYSVTQRPKRAAVERAFHEAEAKRVTPAQEEFQKADALQARKALETVQAEKVRLNGEIAALRRHPASLPRRMQSLCAFTTLLDRHRLQLLEENSSSEGLQRLPKSLTEALARIDSPTQKGAGGELRRYKITGTFANLMQAIEALAADESSPGIPVSLAMDEPDGSTANRVWTLLIWM